MAEAGDHSVTLSLSDLVARTGVPASSIHHYRRSGLIPPPERVSANRFVYGEVHVEALLTLRAQPAAEHDAIVYIHPAGNPSPRFQKHFLWNSIGRHRDPSR